MIRCVCLVQEGQTPDEKQAVLRHMLNAFSERAFGLAADINWIAIPAGSGFTAAKPSTSSVVSMTAIEPMEQEKRALLLKELCDLWARETGCSIDEIVAVINDPQIH